MKSRERGTGDRDQYCSVVVVSGDREGEQGFMLLGLIVAIAIILLFLGVAASTAAYSLRREKEAESARRADQYVRAIGQFYRKNQHYPGSLEQLESTNNVRYLRKRFVDPLTGCEYRLIIVGQNKTTVKGFFGQPLGGIATTTPGAIGSPAGAPLSQGSGAAAGGGGSDTKLGSAGKTESTGGPGTPDVGAGASAGAAASGTNPSSSTGTADSSSGGTGLEAAKGPIMGVGSSASGSSILSVNEQTSYETWEFLYDPRVEQLKAAALNSGASAQHSVENDVSPTQH
ncbi:MAG TPA: type II secretion system protein [Acidobacteriaceae bacterium]|nr:type II secretion system protein [Acidobacteriaceae bacterium]